MLKRIEIPSAMEKVSLTTSLARGELSVYLPSRTPASLFLFPQCQPPHTRAHCASDRPNFEANEGCHHDWLGKDCFHPKMEHKGTKAPLRPILPPQNLTKYPQKKKMSMHTDCSMRSICARNKNGGQRVIQTPAADETGSMYFKRRHFGLASHDFHKSPFTSALC